MYLGTTERGLVAGNPSGSAVFDARRECTPNPYTNDPAEQLGSSLSQQVRTEACYRTIDRAWVTGTG